MPDCLTGPPRPALQPQPRDSQKWAGINAGWCQVLTQCRRQKCKKRTFKLPRARRPRQFTGESHSVSARVTETRAGPARAAQGQARGSRASPWGGKGSSWRLSAMSLHPQTRPCTSALPSFPPSSFPPAARPACLFSAGPQGAHSRRYCPSTPLGIPSLLLLLRLLQDRNYKALTPDFLPSPRVARLLRRPPRRDGDPSRQATSHSRAGRAAGT